MKIQTKIVKRRRREGKTDYRRRLVLLKAKAPRLVIRKSNRYIKLQLVESKKAQDKINLSLSTKELLKYGWPREKSGSLKSVGASYLVGYLIGKKIHSSKEKIIVDIGLTPHTKGSRVYGAVKGAIDAGLKIAFDVKAAPEKERIERYDFFKKVKGEIEKIKQ